MVMFSHCKGSYDSVPPYKTFLYMVSKKYLKKPLQESAELSAAIFRTCHKLLHLVRHFAYIQCLLLSYMVYVFHVPCHAYVSKCTCMDVHPSKSQWLGLPPDWHSQFISLWCQLPVWPSHIGTAFSSSP